MYTPFMSFFEEKLASGSAVLAPMAGFTDAPFRALCRSFGSAWAVTEMVSAKVLAQGDQRSLEIPAPYLGEPDLVIQLFASDPGDAAEASRRLMETYGPSALDLNMGCPVKKVVHKGCGAELMGDPDLAAEIIVAVREASGVPVSAKMRLGRKANELSSIVTPLLDAGVAAIAVHGRTAEQKYDGNADWEPILELSGELAIPVLVSGDVTTAEQASLLRNRGVGVMIARGALGRPWIFSELNGGAPPSWPEIARIMLRHVDLFRARYGPGRDLRALRGHLSSYVMQHQEMTHIREALVRVLTREDVVELLLQTGLTSAELLPSETSLVLLDSVA